MSGQANELSEEVKRRVRVRGEGGLRSNKLRWSNASEDLREGGREGKVIQLCFVLAGGKGGNEPSIVITKTECRGSIEIERSKRALIVGEHVHICTRHAGTGVHDSVPP